MIDTFTDTHWFLSNFYPAEVTYNGITYKNSEAAFQAQKTLDNNTRLKFASYTPSEAKRYGRRVVLRSDWESVKDNIMYEIVCCKFTQHPELGEKLLATGDEILVEGNTWNDTYWGVCRGVGQNVLGKTLMMVRKYLQNKSKK